MLIVLLPLSINAKPFLYINSVDTNSEFPIIKLNLSIMDSDKTWIKGINQENIIIYEDGSRISRFQIKDMVNSNDIFYLIFSIDSSKSISSENHKKLKESAIYIINNSEKNEKFAIYRFNDRVIKLQDFSQSKKQLLNTLNSISRHGSKTLLYNAVYDSIDLISKIKKKRKAIIIFTDGKDEGSSVGANQVIKFAQDCQIPLYFICLKNCQNFHTILRIAKSTGGRLISDNTPKEIFKSYCSIVKNIKNQYQVKYYSNIKNDMPMHTIEVRLKYDNIRDRGKIKIAFPDNYLNFKMPSLLEILIVILICLLIILLFFVAFRNKKQVVVKKLPENYTQVKEVYTEKLTPIQPFFDDEIVLNPDDSEYNYFKAWLVQKDGPDSGKKFPIYWDEITLGRNKENTIVIEDQAVSMKHAKIKKVRKGYRLFDLASDNGTFLNNKKLLRPKQLYDWDEIRLGRSVLIFRGSKIK